MASPVLGTNDSAVSQSHSHGVFTEADGPAATCGQPSLSVLQEGNQRIPLIPSSSSPENFNAETTSLHFHRFSLVDFGEYELNLYQQQDNRRQELEAAITCQESVQFWIKAALIVVGVAISVIVVPLAGFIPALPLMVVAGGLWVCSRIIESKIANNQEEYETLKTAHQDLCNRYNPDHIAAQNSQGLAIIRQTKEELPDLSRLINRVDRDAEAANQASGNDEPLPRERNRLAALDLHANHCTLARMLLNCYTIHEIPQNEEGKAQLQSEQDKLNRMYQHTFPAQTTVENEVEG